MTAKLSDEFMQRMVDEQVWIELSEELKWTDDLLEKYQDKLDWDAISGNGSIMWTVPMLKKFEKKVNWKKLSEELGDDQLTPSIIEAFKDKWDWHELSANSSMELSYELIDLYVDRWDWNMLITHHRRDKVFENCGLTFYEKYKEYIPVSQLHGTSLWYEMVAQRKNQITSNILS